MQKNKEIQAVWQLIHRISVCVFLLLIAGFWSISGALAQTASADLKDSIEDRRQALETIENRLANPDGALLVELRAETRVIRADSTAASVPVREQRDRIAEELAALGAPPAEGQPPESTELSIERDRLAEELADIDQVVRQMDLNLTVAERLLDDIAAARRANFYGNTLAQGPSPLQPKVLVPGLAGIGKGISDTTAWISSDLETRQSNGTLVRDLIILGVAAAIAFILFFPVRNFLKRRIESYMDRNEPTHARQVIAASAQALARTVPGVVGGFIVFQALRITGIVSQARVGDELIAEILWLGLITILAVDGAATAVVAQRRIGWRLMPLMPSRGAVVRLLGLLVTLVLVADAALRAGSMILGAPQESTSIQSAAVSIILATCLFLLTRPNLWRRPSDLSQTCESYLTGRLRLIAPLGAIFALVIIAAALLGYVSLAYFLATSVFFLAGLLVVAICLRGLARELIAYVSGFAEPKIEGEDTKDGGILTFWLGLALDAWFLVAIVAPAALILGAEWSDVRDAVSDAFFGFKIGTVTISIADILAGIAVFFAILWATRAIQTSAEERIFPQTKLDEGIKHSFRTLIGYAGVVIAGLAAVGAVGADLSSLAIVAGALSVGIGFGLQSIVSNFVSGLILLFERPIKVGDWIVVSSGQGYVKRISVRSTEIETFDRSSVIVPNSELITGTVTNLTLGNKVGRIIIPVGASYDADPEHVVAVLKEIVAAHPKILKDPAPFVYFSGLGDNSIDFEVRGFLRDIGGGLGVTNDLRMTIFKRFRDEGIEIPFPQRVVHVKSEGPPQPTLAEPVGQAASPG